MSTPNQASWIVAGGIAGFIVGTTIDVLAKVDNDLSARGLLLGMAAGILANMYAHGTLIPKRWR